MSLTVKLLDGAVEIRKGRVLVSMEYDKIEESIIKLRKNGYEFFVLLSCVDWIDDGQFELVYHLWSYSENEHVMLSTRVPRENTRLKSLRHLFPQIETYEREIHEMYGIVFEGNPRLGDFILEGWPHMPPMRKDFDTEKFVNDHYYQIPEVKDE